MNSITPTLNNVFSVTKETPRKHLPDNWQLFKERLRKEVKGIKWTASVSDIVSKIAELLDIKISKIFTDCWKKSEELKKVLEESKKSPDEKFEIELTEHSINSEHNPYIELRFNNASIYKIKFDINMFFTVKGFILKIQQGDIYEINSGECEAKGTISWEGIKLLEKKLEPLELPTLITAI
jgi:hypothetical protein